MTDTIQDDDTIIRLDVKPGVIMWTWCSKHWDRTDHLWTGNKLICLDCHPDKDPRGKPDGRTDD